MVDSENYYYDNLEKFSYLDDDGDIMNTLFSEITNVEKIKIDKIKDYFDLFVSMLKSEPKYLHTDEHFALRTECGFGN